MKTAHQVEVRTRDQTCFTHAEDSSSSVCKSYDFREKGAIFEQAREPRGGGLRVGLYRPGLRFQIWSFALILFRTFDFVCPFAPSPFFGPFARFPAGKRLFQ